MKTAEKIGWCYSPVLPFIDSEQNPSPELGYHSDISTETQLGITVWGHKTTKEETERIVKIVTAAPELLEALQKTLEGLHKMECADDVPDSVIKTIVSAIKKATE